MEPFTDIAHTIQVALTPVFLLSGIGTLLNVFNTRLARVSDHSEHLNELVKTEDASAERARLGRQLLRLHQRTRALDLAIASGAVGAGMTCAAAFALFVVTARDAGGGMALLVLFGAALVFTISALVAFVADTVLAWHGIRTEGPLPSATKGLVKVVR